MARLITQMCGALIVIIILSMEATMAVITEEATTEAVIMALYEEIMRIMAPVQKEALKMASEVQASMMVV